jgi:hypothetical protein
MRPREVWEDYSRNGSWRNWLTLWTWLNWFGTGTNDRFVWTMTRVVGLRKSRKILNNWKITKCSKLLFWTFLRWKKGVTYGIFPLCCVQQTRACAWLHEDGNRAATRLVCWDYLTPMLHYLLLHKQSKKKKKKTSLLTLDLHRLQQFPTLEILSDDFYYLLPRQLLLQDGSLDFFRASQANTIIKIATPLRNGKFYWYDITKTLNFGNYHKS